jgi:hypothetical protein
MLTPILAMSPPATGVHTELKFILEFVYYYLVHPCICLHLHLIHTKLKLPDKKLQGKIIIVQQHAINSYRFMYRHCTATASVPGKLKRNLSQTDICLRQLLSANEYSPERLVVVDPSRLRAQKKRRCGVSTAKVSLPYAHSDGTGTRQR